MTLQSLCDQATACLRKNNLAEAERLYLEVLGVEPGNFTALHLLGVVRTQQGRKVEALELIASALKINPHDVKALSNYGNVLYAAGRHADALVFFDRALTIKPDHIEALYNRGNAFYALNRDEEALSSFDKVLALSPGDADALTNRGAALRALRRLPEALMSYDKALAINPDSLVALNSRGGILRDLGRLDEALASYDLALTKDPDFAETHKNRGALLCERNRVEEGFAEFTRFAELLYGPNGSAASRPALPHKAKHDQEQRDYLAAIGKADPAALHIEGGARLPTPAVNPDNAKSDIAAQWQTRKPQLVVIDDFLTPTALDALRRFCWGSDIWRRSYQDGYLGAFPEHGFACPLLAQIADELRGVFPNIIRAHPLQYLWGFKYDRELKGINVHADFAAVNVNFWITPDKANLDPDSGGLTVWDTAAPLDWNFRDYNNNVEAIRAFLARNGAKSVTVPHRANRAVIFDSDLFHETDRMRFKDGYQNRRINVTMLYGLRASP